MKKLIKLSMVIIGLMAVNGCTDKKKTDSVTQIEAIEKKTITKDLEMDVKVADQLVAEYLMFAEKYPKAKETPDYIFKAAEITNGKQQYTDALTLFERVYTKYPKYRRAPESMFLCGFINETGKKDLVKAGEYYKKFIDTYPENPLRKDAEASLKNLNKSPEELIREFEKMNKETEPAS